MNVSVRPRLGAPGATVAMALCTVLWSAPASAFSGTGSLLKGARLGLPVNDFARVRTLPKIGEIDALCAAESQPQASQWHEPGIVLRFRNSSGKSLIVFADSAHEGPLAAGVPDGSEFEFSVGSAAIFAGDTVRFHIARADGGKTNRPT